MKSKTRFIKIILLFISISFLMVSMCGCETLLQELENGIDKLTEAFRADEEVYEYGECTLVLCDRADLMTDEEEDELIAAIEPYCRQVNCDVLIITTDAPSMSATSYSGAYVSAFFPEGSEDNISFVIDVNHHEWWMVWYGYLATYLPEGHAYYAFDLADKYMGEDDYGAGFEAMVTYMLKEIDKIE